MSRWWCFSPPKYTQTHTKIFRSHQTSDFLGKFFFVKLEKEKKFHREWIHEDWSRQHTTWHVFDTDEWKNWKRMLLKEIETKYHSNITKKISWIKNVCVSILQKNKQRMKNKKNYGNFRKSILLNMKLFTHSKISKFHICVIIKHRLLNRKKT